MFEDEKSNPVVGFSPAIALCPTILEPVAVMSIRVLVFPVEDSSHLY
uniref:Uncharacterized protein n=1 Tax=Rhizophora mucronata TaxID=61149 RepID=A0A2P2NXA3_RHIMU